MVDSFQFISSIIGLLLLYILCDNNLSLTIRLELRYDVSHGAGTIKKVGPLLKFQISRYDGSFLLMIDTLIYLLICLTFDWFYVSGESIGDACTPDPCENGGSCELQDDSPVCTCLFGFSGRYCQNSKCFTMYHGFCFCEWDIEYILGTSKSLKKLGDKPPKTYLQRVEWGKYNSRK